MKKLFQVIGNTLLVVFSSLCFVALSGRSGTDVGVVVYVLILSILVGIVAVYRNRRFVVWFILSCLMSPLISIIVLFVKKKGATTDELEAMASEYLQKYIAAPDYRKRGAAKKLYLKIKDNKKIYEHEFKDAEEVFSAEMWIEKN